MSLEYCPVCGDGEMFALSGHLRRSEECRERINRRLESVSCGSVGVSPRDLSDVSVDMEVTER